MYYYLRRQISYYEVFASWNKNTVKYIIVIYQLLITVALNSSRTKVSIMIASTVIIEVSVDEEENRETTKYKS